MVLIIGLTYELLTGKYTLPKPADPTTLLARYEAGLFSEMKEALAVSTSKSQLGEIFNKSILPRCRSFIIAVGQRMAYEAVIVSKTVSDEVLAAFEKICIAENASWYIENLGWTQRQIRDAETEAYERVLPQLDQLLDRTGAEKYVTSPLVSEKEWEELTGQCIKFINEELSLKSSVYTRI